jgi:VanZ family protein
LFNRNFFFGALVVLAAIIYVSLYPFRWRIGLPAGGPLHELLLSADRWPESHGDFIANLLLYLPWGFFATRALSNGTPAGLRLLIATLLGFALSLTMEVSQFYIAERYTDMRDVYANTLGALLGGIGALLIANSPRINLVRDADFQPFPALLLAAFVAVRLYPYVPVIDLHKYIAALRPLLAFGSLTRSELFLRGVVWLVVCYLAETLFGRRSALLAFVLIAGGIFVGRVLIVDATLSLASVVSAGIALVLWFAALRFMPGRVAVLAIAFSAVVMLDRLSPFHLSERHSFEWMPFLGLLRGQIDVALLATIEKFFLYGGLIWLLMRAGLRLWRATVAVAVLLLFCSFVEMYIPGRSAGITDALLALLIGTLLRLTIGTRQPAAQPA